MDKFKTLHISEIFVPERLRMVDDDHALAIQASITQHGQFNPVTVRMTPNGEQSYTLVAGAHRYRAIELMDEEGQEIDVLVVKADKDEAILLEIEENLFRNDLSVMDRAVFVETYREQWEKVHGEISRGRPEKRINLIQFSDSPVGLVEEEAKRGFSEVCANRLPFTGSTRRTPPLPEFWTIWPMTFCLRLRWSSTHRLRTFCFQNLGGRDDPVRGTP